MRQPRDLRHLTLNTGHVSRQRRADVAQAVIDQLRPVLDAEGGPVPGMGGWRLDLFYPTDRDQRRLNGAAFFQLADEPGPSKAPAVMAVACWDQAMAESAWSQAKQGYGALRGTLTAVGLWKPIPATPPPVPWLATWLTPAVAVAAPEDVLALGDLERCVAFALMAPAADG